MVSELLGIDSQLWNFSCKLSGDQAHDLQDATDFWPAYIWLCIGMVLPGCQDTGTATVMGKRGQYVWTDGKDEEHLSKGVFKAYTETNLRYRAAVSFIIFSVASSTPALCFAHTLCHCIMAKEHTVN